MLFNVRRIMNDDDDHYTQIRERNLTCLSLSFTALYRMILDIFIPEKIFKTFQCLFAESPFDTRQKLFVSNLIKESSNWYESQQQNGSYCVEIFTELFRFFFFFCCPVIFSSVGYWLVRTERICILLYSNFFLSFIILLSPFFHFHFHFQLAARVFGCS